ncbi:MAG: thioredoxin-disulfide reductase [Chitinivibrionales bacterium]
MENENIIIIGSGPAAMTAGIYASRANLKPLCFEGFQAGGMPGGQLMVTNIVENFPGFPDGIDGQKLVADMKEQAGKHGTRFIMEDVVSIEKGDKGFVIESMNGDKYYSLTVIVATGANAKRLPLESEKKLWGKGISACAVCDGGLPVFRNQPLAIIGGGDSAVEEAHHLTQFGSKIYIIHRRDKLRASKIMQSKALEHEKIEVLWNKVVDEFLGDKKISGLRLRDTKTDELSELEVKGVFEAIGHTPNTSFLNGLLDMDDAGYIKIDPATTYTSVSGIFAAGDVADSRYRQAVSAAGTGCRAAIDAERWLQEHGEV